MCKYLSSLQAEGARKMFIINRDISFTGIKPQRILFCSELETVKLLCWVSSQKRLLKPYYFVSDVFKDK